MFKNYFKIAWRNLIRDKQFTVLNMIGLSTGLACTFLIYIWIHDEVSKDRFITNRDRLYQVMQNVNQDNGNLLTVEGTPDLLPKALKTEVPEVEDAAVIKFPDQDEDSKGILTYNGKSIKARELFVTKNLFDLFSYPLIVGDKDKALVNKSNVLLNEVMAMKLFNTTDVIGRTINTNLNFQPRGFVFNNRFHFLIFYF